jgi:glycosyltransferase involved in cell wall biosynthesis
MKNPPTTPITIVIYLDSVVPSIDYRPYNLTVGRSPILKWIWKRICLAQRSGLTIVYSSVTDQRALLNAIRGTAIQLVLREGGTKLDSLLNIQDERAGYIVCTSLEDLLYLPINFAPKMLQMMNENDVAYCRLMNQDNNVATIMKPDLLSCVGSIAGQTGYAHLDQAVDHLERWMSEQEAGLPFEMNGLTVQLDEFTGWSKFAIPQKFSLFDPQIGDLCCRVVTRALSAEEDMGAPDLLPNSLKMAIIYHRAEERLKQLDRGKVRFAKRVLFISGASAFSGAEMSMCSLCSALHERGWDVHALIALEGHFARELRTKGVKVTCPNMDWSFGGTNVFGYVNRLIKGIAPDIIHCNGFEAETVRYAVRASGRPVVQHVRVENPQYMRDCLDAADALIAVSEFVRDRVIRYDIDPTKVHVVNDEIDTNHFSPDSIMSRRSRRLMGLGERPVIVTFSRVVQRKRIDVLIKTVARLVLRYPDLAVLIITGGFIEAALFAQLKALTRTLKLESCIQWKHFVSNPKEVLSVADCYVLCAEDEAFGRSVAEAMAMQVPVVVSGSGGTKELVKLGGGTIVPSGSVEVFADAIDEFLKEGSQKHYVGRLGRQVVEERCDVSRNVLCIEELYTNLLEQLNLRVPNGRSVLNTAAQVGGQKCVASV